MFQLRPYQQEALTAITEGWREKLFLQCIVLATGTGKTVIFSHLPDYVKQSTGKKTLVLAHREELLTQAADKIRAISPELRAEVEQAIHYADDYADVVVASVATLGRAESERIKRFNPDDFGLIIIDEAHHSCSETYKRILTYFGVNKEEGVKEGHPYLLGVTATPFRGDNIGLDEVFDDIVYKYDMRQGIADGYLVPLKGFTVRTDTSLADVATRAGDFAIGELSETVNTPERNQLIIESYKKISGEKGILFAVDVQHAEDLTAAFIANGLPSACVTGAMSSADRATTLEGFRNNQLKVLVNVGVFTEGFDCPDIECVMLARPTKSKGLYQQMVGRGLRLAEGKTDCKIIDFVDSLSQHSIVTASSLIGLSKPMAMDGEDIMEVEDKVKELLQVSPNEDLLEIDLSDIDTRIKEVDIVGQAQLSSFVQEHSNLAWVEGYNGYKIFLGSDEETGVRKEAMIVELPIGYEIEFIEKTKTSRKVVKLLHENTKEKAMKVADKYIRDNYSDSLRLVNTKKKWRAVPASDKQKALLRKLGQKDADKLSKGEASNLISKLLNKKKNI